jgi:transcriptional regulator with XRE-family HTH domain
MSYLSIALQRISETRHLTRSDIARVSGISQSYISRLCTGEYRDLSDPNFISLLKVFSADPTAQAELVAARCMDVRAGAAGIPGADLVDITVKVPAAAADPSPAGAGEGGRRTGEGRGAAPPLPLVPLPQETERAFDWLRRQCPVNPDLEKHLVGYAKLTGMK